MSKYLELTEYLLKDYWSGEEACMIFAGFDPNKSSTDPSYESPKLLVNLLDGTSINGRNSGTEGDNYEKGKERFERLNRIWQASKHDYTNARDGLSLYRTFSIEYCIKWAISKRITIPWLEWAIENNYLTSEFINPQNIAPLDNDTENSRERENRLRLIAYLIELLTDTDKKSSFSSQSQLRDYLIEHYGGETGKGISTTTLDRVFSQANKEKET